MFFSSPVPSHALSITHLSNRQLLKSNNVLFAGYKVPHPLEPHFILKIQTDGSLTPQKALEDACQTLIALVADLKVKFDKEFDMKSSLDSVTAGGVGAGVGGFGMYGGAYAAGLAGAGDGAGGWGDSRNRGVGADYLDFGS